MRRALPLLIVSLSWLVTSCGGGNPVFGDGDWLVRCPETDPPAGCVNGDAHAVRGFTDEEGIQTSCTVDKDGDERVFGFRITDERDPEQRGTVTGSNIRFEGDGGPVSACQLTIQEGGNTYRTEGSSDCGSAAPSPDSQPCQIRDLEVDKDADPRPRIRAEILCRGIVVPSNPSTLRRDLTGTTPGTAATFEFDGCDGNVL